MYLRRKTLKLLRGGRFSRKLSEQPCSCGRKNRGVHVNYPPNSLIAWPLRWKSALINCAYGVH